MLDLFNKKKIQSMEATLYLLTREVIQIKYPLCYDALIAKKEVGNGVKIKSLSLMLCVLSNGEQVETCKIEKMLTPAKKDNT